MSDRVCIDLFAGTHSATKYFSLAGWAVDHVELSEGRDVREYIPPKADFVWASPPCTEYSYLNRSFPTWESKYDASAALWLHSLRVVKEARPRFWIIENVKGAQQIWGKTPYHYGPFFLWGYFPFQELPMIPWTTSLKGTHANRRIVKDNGKYLRWAESRTAVERAMIPDALAKAVYETTERSIDSPEPEDTSEDQALEAFFLTRCADTRTAFAALPESSVASLQSIKGKSTITGLPL